MVTQEYLGELREIAEGALAKIKQSRAAGLTKGERRRLIEEAESEMSVMPEKWWRLFPDGDKLLEQFDGPEPTADTDA